ncbi:MAG: hypothetical protein C5B49_13435 [Bdellovibrio sp.]|nr:MAG: hypothetical protein C5B49_13435 [Bdellovibrio sp.]
MEGGGMAKITGQGRSVRVSFQIFNLQIFNIRFFISSFIPFFIQFLKCGGTAYPTVLFSMLLTVLLSPEARAGKSFSQAFDAAVHRSETIDIQKELVEQSTEVRDQAQGALFPTISASGSWMHLNTPNNGNGNPLFLSDQTTTKVTLDQPLFRGMKEYAALHQTKALLESQKMSLKNSLKQLFYDTATAYYNVLALESDEKNYLLEIEINRKRLRELEHFLRIGRSRETDLLTFKANIASLEAQVAATRGQLDAARAILAFLTGWNPTTELTDEEKSSPPVTLEKALHTIDDRADVKAAEKTAEAYHENIRIARSGHFPTLDFVADYFIDRPGFDRFQVWDAGIQLNIPIFAGGIVQSQVRQATSVAKQYELNLSAVRRTAEQEIRTFHAAVAADEKQLDRLAEAVALSKQNYEVEERDYRNGLVTNLEVLQAINTYQDGQRQLARLKITSQTDALKLQAATGGRNEIQQAPPAENDTRGGAAHAE